MGLASAFLLSSGYLAATNESNAQAAVPMTVVGIYVHGFFLILAIGLPFLVLTYEALGIIRKDREYISIARTVTKVFGASFAFGVITGTLVEFGLIQVWSGTLLALGTGLFAPMFFELYAFMAEIILYVAYLYFWDSFKNRWIHWLIGFGLLLGATLSAYLILTANAWMNVPWGTGDLLKSILPWTPTLGPDVVNKTAALNLIFAMSNSGSLAIADPSQVQTFSHLLYDPFVVLFNPNGIVTSVHTVLACITIANFEVAAVFSYLYLKRDPKKRPHYLKALKIAYGIAAVATILVPIAGDEMARLVYEQQYAKFVGIENLPNAGGTDPFIGLILHGDPNYFFKGFDALSAQVGQSILPNAAQATITQMREIQQLIFPMYLTMVISGILIFVFAIGYFSLYLKPLRRVVEIVTRMPVERFVVYTTFPAAILATVATGAGWAVREIGRQPWVVYGLVQRWQVVTPNPITPALTFSILFLEIVLLAGGLGAIYVVLTWHSNEEVYGQSSKEEMKTS